jgi:hypothetical protein
MMVGRTQGRGSEPYWGVRRHGPSPEYARQRGKIRPRSRNLVRYPG